MNRSEKMTFRNKISNRSKGISFVFLLVLIWEIFLIDGREDLDPFLMIFIGSMTLYMIYFPWTRLKEIVSTGNRIIQKERIGIGFSLKDFEVLRENISSLRFKSGIARIKTAEGSIKLDLNHLVLHEEESSSISIKLKRELSPQDAYKLIFKDTD